MWYRVLPEECFGAPSRDCRKEAMAINGLSGYLRFELQGNIHSRLCLPSGRHHNQRLSGGEFKLVQGS